MEDRLNKHIKDTEDGFKIAQQDRIRLDNVLTKHLVDIKKYIEVNSEHMEKSNEFMKNLSWLADISKGTQLLKKPSLWVLALIIGLAAFLGGLKAVVVGFLGFIGINSN